MTSEHKRCFNKSADRPFKLNYLNNYLTNLNKHINKQDSRAQGSWNCGHY